LFDNKHSSLHTKLDTTRRIEVPEGIEIELPLAGLVSRSLAFLLDGIIRWIALWIISAVVAFAGKFGIGFYSILFFLAEWFYPVFFEVLNGGQTPGKKSMGIRVVNDDGTPVTWSTSLVRNLLRFVDFLPLFYATGIVSLCVSSQFKHLGDFAAGTLVVHTAEKKSVPAKLEVQPRAPRISLALHEQSAIIAYAERRDGLSEGRRYELANWLSPFLKESEQEKAQQVLLSLAKYLRGQG